MRERQIQISLGNFKIGFLIFLLFLLAPASFADSAQSAPRIDVIDRDLMPLIKEAVKHPNRFAVDVRQPVGIDRNGEWVIEGDRSIWQYAVRIPSAVSLSFYASTVTLPESAVLTVKSTTDVYTYRAADTSRGELWSRIAKGNELKFQLSIKTAERPQLAFSIDSFQAGYRGFGGVVGGNAEYQLLAPQAASASVASCVQNYDCSKAAGNTAAAQATVGLIVGNSVQCTGTLINNALGNNAPYVLTARHCQTGDAGGGNPSAAQRVTVYWNAMTPCGEFLGTLYDAGTPRQTGGVTLVEQQDAWLILLSSSPVVDDAHFAGFDATGGAVLGGYSIHHALSFDKQFVEWFGQALPVQRSGASLGVNYISNFLEVVNQLGNVGPGASGGSLFDQNNRLVGTLTLGRSSLELGGYGVCPANTPIAPNGTNAAGYFTSLAAVWNSTVDVTSSTGTVTLKQILDPYDTSHGVVDSVQALPGLNFRSSALVVTTGGTIVLSWNAVGATSCLATGGTNGDGWSGAVPIQGQVQISETVPATVSYELSCNYSGGKTIKAYSTVVWTLPAPLITLSNASESRWVGSPWRISWISNVGPCSISGPGLALTDQQPVGTVTVVQSVVGLHRYSWTCGVGSRTTSTSVDMQFVTPSVQLTPSNTDVLFGQIFELRWSSLADSCTTLGGADGDGWSGRQIGPIGNFFPKVPALGTYTYYLICRSGDVSAQAQVTVQFGNDAPYATIVADSTDIAAGQMFTLTWKSNLFWCTQTVNPFVGTDTLTPVSTFGSKSDGGITYLAKYAGNYVFSMNCGIGTAGPYASTPPVEIRVVNALTVELNATAVSIQAGQSFTLNWLANNATSCSASGDGVDTSQWGGMVARFGSRTINTSGPGSSTYMINCVGLLPGITKQAQVTVVVTAVTVTGSSSNSNKGGGGILDIFVLLALVMCLLCKDQKLMILER